MEEVDNKSDNGDGRPIDLIFLEFARKVIKQAEEDFSPPVDRGKHIQFFSDPSVGSWGFKIDEKPTYEALVYLGFYHTILSMKEANTCARRLWEIGIFGIKPDRALVEATKDLDETSLTFERIRVNLIRGLLYPIIDIINRYSTLQPTDAQILERFTLFKGRLILPSVQWDMIFPLLNFVGDFLHEVSLGNHFKITSFPGAEKTEVWNRDWEFIKGWPLTWPTDPMDGRVFTRIQFKLVCTIYEGRYGMPSKYDQEEIVEELEKIITAFRLLKPGNIGIPTWFWKGYPAIFEDQVPPSISISSAHYLIPSEGAKFPYMFNPVDLPSLQAIFEALQRLGTSRQIPQERLKSQNRGKNIPHKLAIPLRRFNQSYNREIPEDQIIDLVIALESCLFDGKDTELKYHFSLRGAALLAKAKAPGWEPYRSKKLLDLMYDIRSSIVHNGMLLQELISKLKKLEIVGILPDEFPQQCENIVRDILRSCVLELQNRKSKKDLLEDLDEYILKNMANKGNVETETNP